MSKKRIYLDYASLTPIDPRVVSEIKAFSASKYANPSSLYIEGVNAKKALSGGRKKVASFIQAHPDEIVFTSGGTEANSLAIEGVVSFARIYGIQKPHIIISAIEHSSIIETVKMLEKFGCEVTQIGVNDDGIVSLDELKKAIKDNTVIVSIMTVNNEIGSIQPIRDIAKIVRDTRKKNGDQTFEQSTLRSDLDFSYPLFHTDAAQGALYQDLNVEKSGVDLLTLDGSKVYGPRGVGCLFVKRNTPIQPIVFGGGQESGLRSGTENIPAIMGFAKAIEIARNELSKKGTIKQLEKFRANMIEGLKSIKSNIIVNGYQTSPHILNVSIPGIDNEFFLFQLDAKGIACSTKSSCLRDEEESYVLKAIKADSKKSIRFSFGRWTTIGEIKHVVKVIGKILE